jgi:hypothetical protein
VRKLERLVDPVRRWRDAKSRELEAQWVRAATTVEPVRDQRHQLLQIELLLLSEVQNVRTDLLARDVVDDAQVVLSTVLENREVVQIA